MSKFNKTSARPATAGTGFIVSETIPSGQTHEGAPGYKREEKGELFLLAVSNFVGEPTFYESADARDSRYVQLIKSVAVGDRTWVTNFLRWLRSEGNMRSASIVGGVEAAYALAKAGIPGGRQIVSAVLQRADEPGEALAYYRSRYGRVPVKPVKRGIADAAARLYTEYSLLKYDTASKGYRFGDVLSLTHAEPTSSTQSDLFRWAIERRHGRDTVLPEGLGMLANNQRLRDVVAGGDFGPLTDSDYLRAAGMTWEDALSFAGPRVNKAKLWEALIPTMGYMALLRNLRNFDEAGVSDAVAAQVAARLSDPEQVAKSRQFPFRFLSAYEAAPSLRWAQALDVALRHSLKHLPTLPGRTLVLVDTSGSMTGMHFSSKSKVTPAKASAIFGAALACKGENVDLYGFATGIFEHKIPKGGSVIKEVDRFLRRNGEAGHGTEIARSLQAAYRGHDRVVLISDMQTMGTDSYGRSVSSSIPANIPLYGFNLGGYQHGAYASGVANRVEFGGLTDATFRTIPLLEAGAKASWPWVN